MSDADDPNAIVFCFPAYVVFRAAAGGGEEIVLNRGDGPEPYLPVFTDQDEADRFAATLPPGAAPMVLWEPEELADVVRQAAALGVGLVAPDPGRRAYRVPADRFLDAIAGLPPGQPG
jgi:hypothetical protein